MKAVYAIQDESSHWYLIPIEMQDEFSELHERACSGDHEAEDIFEETFSQYRTGGCLNNKQLYVKD